MMTLLGGVVALLIGVIFLIFWWAPFITIIQAAVPLVLILGGALATYLGFEEWKDAQAMAKSDVDNYPDPEVERYKAEAEKYKSELEELKKNNG